MSAAPSPMHQVSACIVVYRNDPEQVEASIRSVLSSQIRAICTVVDNSPTPELREVAAATGAEYIFPGRNLGFGGGHNLAMRVNRQRAEYCLIQNPDIRFSQEVLPALYRYMSEHPDAGIVMPRILYPDGSEQRLCKRLPEPLDLVARRFLGSWGEGLFKTRLDRYELRHLDLNVVREVPNLSGCFMFIRSAALEKTGYFDERFFMYMEDVDLCRRIGRHYKTMFFPGVSVQHEYAKGSYRSLPLLRLHALSAIRYFSKWGWFRDPERDALNQRSL